MREGSGFRARGARSLVNFLKNGSGRVAGNDGDGDDAATGGFDFFAANDLVTRPVATLSENVGEQRGDNLAGSQVVEDDHGVHRFEGGENFRALTLGDNRTAGTFQLAHAAIAVQANDEHVTEFASELKAANVARVKQVEAAVGENDALAVAFLAAKPHNRLLQCEDGRAQRISMQEKTSDDSPKSKMLVYHARERQRLQARMAR